MEFFLGMLVGIILFVVMIIAAVFYYTHEDERERIEAKRQRNEL